MDKLKLAQFYRDRGLWTDERIGWHLDGAARRWGDRAFLRMEDRHLSFAGLNRHVVSAAHFLVKCGARPDECIVMQSGNCLELIAMQFATWRIGAISVPIVPIYRTHEMTAIIETTRPTIVAAARQAGSRAPFREIDAALAGLNIDPKKKVLFGEGDAVEGWVSLPDPDTEDASTETIELPDPASTEKCCTILFTSGTTSAPKGVLMSSRALLSGMHNWRMNIDLSSADVAFSGAPLTHVGAFYSALLVPLCCGARTVLMSHWDPDRATRMIEEEQATYMAGATVFLHDLVEQYERGVSPTHRLKMFSSGGAATPPSLIERAERVGIKASRSYGMTEMCGTIAQANRHFPLERRMQGEGPVAFGSEIEIVDDDDRQMCFGEIGHIRIRSPQMMNAYTDPAVTAAQMRDGWFYPGDIGAISKDGWLTMTGRSKDIINRGGEKFSAQDIELALMAYQAVLAAAVIGLPDMRLGEVVCACLVLRDGAGWTGPDNILAHLEAFGLARPKFPIEWLIVDALPHTASGKVQKNKLFDQAMAQRRVAEASMRKL